MSLVVKPGTEWPSVHGRCCSVAPEAFSDGRPLNFWGGRWRSEGAPTEVTAPVDGTVLAGPARLEEADAKRAIRASLNEHRTWAAAPFAERRSRVLAAVGDLAGQRDLLALLLVWEVGHSWPAALSEVDTFIDGIRWYGEHILEDHCPLPGPVSHFASCAHPLSVLLHAMFVQALVGNAAIAKAPATGGVHCLTVATALAARHGLPLTLVGGGEAELSASSWLGSVSHPDPEPRGCWGVWEFTDWPALTTHVRVAPGQRYVVQRSLFDDFLAAYLPVLRGLSFGHPLAVSDPADPLPALDFGSLINDVRVKELRDTVDDAISGGGVPLHRGTLDDGRFLPGQDTAAYLAPVSVLDAPRPSPFHEAEPSGPVDSVVLVDTEAELLAAMDAGTVVCDDEATARRLTAR